MSPEKRPYGLCDACRLVRRAIIDPHWHYCCAGCGFPLRNVSYISETSAALIDELVKKSLPPSDSR